MKERNQSYDILLIEQNKIAKKFLFPCRTVIGIDLQPSKRLLKEGAWAISDS